MTIRFSISASMLFAFSAAVTVSAPASAQTKTVASGTTTLPMSGLVINLPADKTLQYKVSGSFSLNDAGTVYEGRDVIDDFDPKTGKLHNGYWILTGYYDAKGCDAVLATVSLLQPWAADANFWGKSWKLRGGMFDFKNTLGQKPTVVMCRTEDDGRAFLLYRFMIENPPANSRENGLKAITSAKVLAAASRAYDAKTYDRSGVSQKAIIKNRGKLSAVRKLKLAKVGFEIMLPDDGTVWLTNTTEHADMLNRLAPSLPSADMELAYGANIDCKMMFDALNKQPRNAAEEAKPAINVASGWQVGPVILAGKDPERTLCLKTPKGAAMAGLFLDPGDNNAAPYRNILDAIKAAAP
ncbi:hypothetical protein [Sphingorhabdus sp.]|uniref:hypothetical protein n=2 Tax=Sphingorhabdus sp. TaxID=1902408 RepID=UPI003BB0DE56|nr:hypothetical protein [Sphingomonadales bacterium]MBL0022773.1 hypothetical protein [Sphingomonadales bacterium]